MKRGRVIAWIRDGQLMIGLKEAKNLSAEDRQSMLTPEQFKNMLGEFVNVGL